MKELKINVPEGYEIDKENSTFECIKFKPVVKRWRDDAGKHISGYYIAQNSYILSFYNNTTKPKDCCIFNINIPKNYNVFATEKQAKSALAMARISQIMANDERFGGSITDEEWDTDFKKEIICKYNNRIDKGNSIFTYYFLAFHSTAQRDLFLEENEDLVKDYLMID